MTNHFKITRESFTKEMYNQYKVTVSQICDKYRIIGRHVVYGEIEEDDSGDCYAALQVQLCTFFFDEVYMSDVLAYAASYEDILRLKEVSDAFYDRAAKYMNFPEILKLSRPRLEVEMIVVSPEGFPHSVVFEDMSLWQDEDARDIGDVTTLIPPPMVVHNKTSCPDDSVYFEDEMGWEVESDPNQSINIVCAAMIPRSEKVVPQQLETTLIVQSDNVDGSSEIEYSAVLDGECSKLVRLSREGTFMVSVSRRVIGYAYSDANFLDEAYFRSFFQAIRRKNRYHKKRHKVLEFGIRHFEEWLSHIRFPVNMMPYSVYLHLLDYIHCRKRKDWFNLYDTDFISWDSYGSPECFHLGDLRQRDKKMCGYSYSELIHFEDHLAEYYGPRLWIYSRTGSPLDDVYDTSGRFSVMLNQ